MPLDRSQARWSHRLRPIFGGGPNGRNDISQEGLSKVRYIALKEGANKLFEALLEIKAITDVVAVVKAAALIPIPPFFIATRDPYGGEGEIRTNDGEDVASLPEGPMAIRVMLTLDGKPWANPQVLHSGTAYDVGLTLERFSKVS